MLETLRARRGIVTAPHHLAAQAGLDIIKKGGTAVEAAIASGASLAVLYPHMTGIGGDGFWLIAEPGKAPIAIDACGRSGRGVDIALYRRAGLAAIPWRGPLAANSVAGTVSGWQAALDATRGWQEPLKLSDLLEAAIHHAEAGIVVTRSQADLTADKSSELIGQPGFASTFLVDGKAPREGAVLKLPALAATLRQLARDGLESFYRGELARGIAADLARVGSPLLLDDLTEHRAVAAKPLSVKVRGAKLFNTAPPTQGLASLIILALFDRLGVAESENFEYVHGLVEATKQAFLIRDRHIGDPAGMSIDPVSFLADDALDELTARIDPASALPWPYESQQGDTIWLGAVDSRGCMVSFIQSIYFEYGSGVVLPETGICWQNRGASFRLEEAGWNSLRSSRKPFHTLNPAMALFDDGRQMAYGTMGGEGQPQTQAAVFSRYAFSGMPLQASVTAPRWLLGRTWGDESVTLKLEDRFPHALIEQLARAGHVVETVASFTSTMGHAGAIVRHGNGVLEGATDPRSDGAVAGW